MKDRKVITPKIHRTVPAHMSIGIAYGIVRDLDRVEAFTVTFRINKKGEQIPQTQTIPQPDITLWIEKPLIPGDSIYISAEPTLGLLESIGKTREQWKIGAFWEVQGDGTLECTGT